MLIYTAFTSTMASYPKPVQDHQLNRAETIMKKVSTGRNSPALLAG
jgi:hypothetical protein